jgi:hypothetical protein
MNSLSTFNGYTVDTRQKQFRKSTAGQTVEAIDFASQQGKALLAELVELLNVTDGVEALMFWQELEDYIGYCCQ